MMNQMNKAQFVCIDCETTGLDPKQDRIIEVAAIRFSITEVFDQYESLINPECIIPESSIAIHHITPDMVADKPIISTILPHLLQFIGKHIIVGHGVGFDIDVIATAAERANIPCTLRHNLTIDTLRMARLYGDSPTNSLEQLRRHFNVENEGAHRAMSDVIVNVEVFKHLSKQYRRLEHIFEALSRPVLMKTMPLGPHKGRLLKEIPLEYLRWAANKDFDQDLLFSLRSELKRRKSGNLFTQAGNPFADL
jgi:DNA polymerase-3 subunit epsilon